MDGDIQRSGASPTRRDRRALPATIAYPQDLPIVEHRAEIVAALTANQVVVVCGETGSGKSTQLPKICLELASARAAGAALIGHTQPRRIAARTIARRIADELGAELGAAVGYKIRFSDRTRRGTLIKVMTDGILLAETQRDRMLASYDTIIVDEAHERTLNIDFLLGYLKQLLPRRPELRVVVTSATIDPLVLSEHFGGAPIVEVSGRTHPVAIEHRPLVTEDGKERDQVAGVLDAVDELAAHGPGDILVFLAGEREIRETAEALRKHHPPQTEILPLYARLSATEQNRVFEPHAARRIVLATNVAETSLTVPGVRFVVDAGTARISRYRPRSRVQQLPIEPISQASARQRAGRCGRVGPGVCIRLYAQEDFEQREPFTPPELQRTNLASVILQMKALGLGDMDAFPFVSPPTRAAIKDGHDTLRELGALDARDRLTKIGRQLARLPLDPRLGRMVLAAQDERCLTEVLVIAAALSIQDPRERPLAQAAAADEQHRVFADPQSDFLAFLNVWRAYHEQKRHSSWSKLKTWCREHFISFLRMREWVDVHGQLKQLVREAGMPLNREDAPPDAIHRAVLTGLLQSIGVRGDRHAFTGAGGSTFHIFPASGLFKKPPRWVMAAAHVETSRRFARTVAQVQPQWIERLGAHLIKRSHAEPHWDRSAAQAYVFERITIFGLELVARRRVPLAAVDRSAARAMFIHRALVEGEYDGDEDFFRHNQSLVETIRAREAKRRKRDVLVDTTQMEQFYDMRLPAEVTSGRTLERWRRAAEQREPRVLHMRECDLVRADASDAPVEDYPDTLAIGDASFDLTYELDPGGPADGVTLHVPLPLLEALTAERLAWLVPGMIEEKITALMRTLPKQLRRHFVPIPDTARRCREAMRFGAGSLLATLSDTLHRQVGVPVPPNVWRPDEVPEHLRMRVRVFDEAGEALATGRDLRALRDRLGRTAAQTLAERTPSELQRAGITAWDFGDLPSAVNVRTAGTNVVGYPALVDEGESVTLTLVGTAEAARAFSHGGARRLLTLECRAELHFQIEHLPQIDALRLAFAPLGDAATLVDGLTHLTVEHAFLGDSPEIRTEADFRATLDAGWPRLGSAAHVVADRVLRVLELRQAIRLTLETLDKPVWADAFDDASRCLDRLVSPDVMTVTPPAQLEHLPRYLAALERRLEKLRAGGTRRDRRERETLAPLWAQYETHRAETGESAELSRYRWMLEELTVSLFAQELGTAEPISLKRVAAQWERVVTPPG